MLNWLLDAVLTREGKRRIRLSHLAISLLVYVCSAALLCFNALQGWIGATYLADWLVAVVSSQVAIYVAIRSGWSERFPDPALTPVQLVLGVILVEWAYAICGGVRTVSLFPLLLIFAFGAFSLSWRRFAWLTAFTLATLAGVMLAMQYHRASDDWARASYELSIDVSNFLMLAILLPAISMVAIRLSILRRRMESQRWELSRALEQVQRLATHDELTGLPNRRSIQEGLVEEASEFKSDRFTFCVALIDLDRFKEINDGHGHARGDDVLRMFAAEARAMLRSCDVIARWGGEEFLVLLPGTGLHDAGRSIQRLLDGVRDLALGLDAPLSFSAGISLHQRGEDVMETVARADRCMYQAKESGRSRLVLQSDDGSEDRSDDERDTGAPH